jgi:hypothetical protein
MQTRGRDMASLAAIVIVALALAVWYAWWRQSRNGKANSLLAAALTVEEAPVVAPTAPAPGSPIPVQQAGTYATEQAKLEAALPQLLKAADAYPGTDAGIAARYHAAGALAALADIQGRTALSGSHRQSREPRLRTNGEADSRTSRFSGACDSAIKIYRDATTDTQSRLPLDGVLMQRRARRGKKNEAAHAFTRGRGVPQSYTRLTLAARWKRRRRDNLSGRSGLPRRQTASRHSTGDAHWFDPARCAAWDEHDIASRGWWTRPIVILRRPASTRQPGRTGEHGPRR